ncbi:phage minor capsid protein [Ligilactobacillus agilis]|nr:phage minor capsid protein [Ligilactobacillus agilis]
MDSKQKLDQDTNNIANLYSNLEDLIFTEIIKVLQRGHYENVTQDNVVQWQAQQLSQMGALTKRVIDLMADFDGISPSEIETILKKDGYEILDEVSQELKYSDQKSQPISNESFDMLDSMVRQTTDTLNNTINQTLLSRNYGINPVMRTYQEILKRSTIETVTGLKTHDRAVKDAIYQQLDKGIEVMRDKSGRAWSLEGYTRMVLTTTANRTYNDLRTKRMQEFGQVLCLMSSHPNSREACAYIQGKVVNIVPTDDPDYNDKYDSIYNHGYGEPAGTLGINCRHKLFPFTPGVNVNNMTQYNPKEAIRNGNLRQKQRYYERSIRDAKKRLKAAEELGDIDMVNQTKTLLRARQSKLREFIKATNANSNVPILTRDYNRESVVGTDARHINYINQHRAKELATLKRSTVLMGFQKQPKNTNSCCIMKIQGRRCMLMLTHVSSTQWNLWLDIRITSTLRNS